MYLERSHWQVSCMYCCGVCIHSLPLVRTKTGTILALPSSNGVSLYISRYTRRPRHQIRRWTRCLLRDGEHGLEVQGIAWLTVAIYGVVVHQEPHATSATDTTDDSWPPPAVFGAVYAEQHVFLLDILWAVRALLYGIISVNTQSPNFKATSRYDSIT